MSMPLWASVAHSKAAQAPGPCPGAWGLPGGLLGGFLPPVGHPAKAIVVSRPNLSLKARVC